jgi:hypothetical protein
MDLTGEFYLRCARGGKGFSDGVKVVSDEW